MDADGGAATGASTTGLLPFDLPPLILGGLAERPPAGLLKEEPESRDGVAVGGGGAAVKVGKALGKLRGISRGGRSGTPATTSTAGVVEGALLFIPTGLLNPLLLLLLSRRRALLEGSGADAARDTRDLAGDSEAFAVAVVVGCVRPERVRSSSSSAHRSNICSRVPTDRRNKSDGCVIGLSTCWPIRGGRNGDEPWKAPPLRGIVACGIVAFAPSSGPASPPVVATIAARVVALGDLA